MLIQPFRSNTTTKLARRKTSFLAFLFTDVSFLQMFLGNLALFLKVSLCQLFLQDLHSFLWYNERCCYTAQQVTCRETSVLTDRLTGPPRLPYVKKKQEKSNISLVYFLNLQSSRSSRISRTLEVNLNSSTYITSASR